MPDPKTFTHRIVATTPLHRGFLKVDRLDIEAVTRAGETVRYRREVESHRAGAAVLPYDPVLRVAVMVRQLRIAIEVAGVEPYPLEAIAGLVDVDGEDGEATARREAEEEAGLTLKAVTQVAAAFSSPGFSTERLWLYLAEIDLATARTGDGGGAEHEDEDIEVVVLPLAELARLADASALLDLKTFALVQSLRLQRPDLF